MGPMQPRQLTTQHPTDKQLDKFMNPVLDISHTAIHPVWVIDVVVRWIIFRGLGMTGRIPFNVKSGLKGIMASYEVMNDIWSAQPQSVKILLGQPKLWMKPEILVQVRSSLPLAEASLSITIRNFRRLISSQFLKRLPVDRLMETRRALLLVIWRPMWIRIPKSTLPAPSLHLHSPPFPQPEQRCLSAHFSVSPHQSLTGERQQYRMSLI